MEKPTRSYQLVFAILIGAIGAFLFASVVSGQAFVFLEKMPAGDIGLFLHPSEVDTFTLEFTEEVTGHYFSDPGTYRAITTDSALRAQNLTLHSQKTGEVIPFRFENLARYEPYDTELLQGRILFDFAIEEPGDYEWHGHVLDLRLVTPTMTVFPDYLAENRQRILMGALVLAGFLVLGMVRYFKPVRSKAQRREKRQKWDDFVADKE